MEKFTRGETGGDSGSKIIIVEQCWECPYAESTAMTIGCYVICSLTQNEYHFDDNLIQFSTPSSCPLLKKE